MMLRSRVVVCARSMHRSVPVMKPEHVASSTVASAQEIGWISHNKLGENANKTPRNTANNRFRDLLEAKEYPKKKQQSAKRPQRPAGPNRRVRFANESGSEQSRAALKWLVSQVHQVSPSYRVKLLDQGKPQPADFVEIANSLNLKQQGVQVIKQDEGVLVKLVKVEDMVKTYSNHLAQVREQELVASGNLKMQRILANRAKAERKKSASKVVSFKWSISLSDLKEQKRTELMGRLNKGEHFTVELASRKRRPRDEDEWQLELKKRELVFDTVESILAELPCSVELEESSLEEKVVLKVTPTAAATQPTVTEPAVTATPKKAKKQQKAQPVAAKPQEKKNEDDLDAMYSFKIDD
ncbi:hypothetical protein DIURU_003705 [Diutina rugosa]|uniref:Altered inheritance of mitochondria protein 23, mitochondrial n=1 Tax=Diutina rugosa TaxID=5481 RepID=A0A642URR5_DIURU|nr:uncharacterized protein DIURU_003705 [Diutina rugosa]KAA8900593.1 hypothetical protein DIURU_003705 [Diutina rugosa]